VGALAQSALCLACSRTQSLPLHLAVSSRLTTLQSSAEHCNQCTLCPTFPGHGLSTEPAGIGRTMGLDAASVVLPFVPAGLVELVLYQEPVPLQHHFLQPVDQPI